MNEREKETAQKPRGSSKDIQRTAEEERKTKTGGDEIQEEDTAVLEEIEEKTGSDKLRGSG